MNEKRPFVFGVKKNTIYKFALLIVVSLLITFFGMSKIEAYYRKNVNTSVFFGTAEYAPLTFVLDKTIYPSGNNSSEVGLTVNNSNNYNVTYTLSFSNQNATYLVDGSALTTYEVNASSGNAHVITINGATGTNITVSINVLLPYSVTHTKVINFDNVNPTANDIGGGTTLKTGSQGVTLKCSDNNSVTAYYFGTTEPTSASGINTTTSADLTAIASSSGLSKTINAEGTYWLACRDAAGNFAKKSIVIRKYQVQNVLVKLGGSVTPYTSTNYELNGSASTYYVKNGTTLTLTSIYTIPAGGTASTFKGYTTSAPSTNAQTPSTTNSVVASDNTTTYYMWFDRTTRVLTYDFNTANNMNYWLYYMYQERFSISYDSNTKMSTLSVAGDSGWEIVYMPIATVSGKRYRVEFDYINPNGYSALSSSYGGIGVQALTTIANSDNLSNDLETIYLSTAQNNNVQHLNIEFTATGTNTYLAFNFGMVADGAINTVKLGNFKIVETLTHGASVSSIPSLSRTGYTFDGWYTATSGGTKLTTSTAINSDITYYAHDSQTSYTITYNLNGGSASNPGTYNVNTATITLNNPTRSGATFMGWAGSNDLSTGTSAYTTSSPYVAGTRDHSIGNDFAVTAGNTYRIFIVAKRINGSINMKGGIWYTEQSTGSSWDGYSSEYIYLETLNDGWARYYKDVTVPEGKTRGRIYVQIDQQASNPTTTWHVADAHAVSGTTVTIPRGSTGNKTYNAYWLVQYTLTLRYNVNGGTITTGTGSERWRASSSLVQRSTDSGSSWTTITAVLSASTTDYDLWNVGTYGATKTGYTINSDSAYNTKADGTGVNINQQNTSSNTTNAVTIDRINGGPLTSSKTIDIYIKWVETTATLTYNANGCGTAPSNVTMKYTAATNAASSMTMASGWTLTGWNTNSAGTGTSYAAGAQVKAANVVPSAITLYAQCTKSTTYTVTYNGNGNTGGSTSASSCTSTARNGGSFPSCNVSLRTNGFTKSGWTFNGWGTGTGSTSGDAAGASLTLTGNVTRYATWKQTITRTASYNGNGNTGGSTSNTSCTFTAYNGNTSGSCNVTLASNGFSKTGHTFSKWAEGSTSGTQRSAGTSVSLSSDKVFYAIWSVNSYTLTLAGAYPIATSFDGQTVTLAGNVAVPSFASSTLSLAANTSYTVSFDYVTSEVNNQFDVDFFPDGLPQYNPTATTSSQHLEWVTSSTDSRMSNCQLRFFDDFQGATEKDIVISNIMLSRNIVVTKTYGSTYGTLPTPSRTGYVFAGWYNAPTGGTQVTDSTQITGDTTWYARWTNNTTYHWRALCACYGNSTFSRWITGGGGSTNPSDATWQCMNSPGTSACSRFCQNNQGSYQGISSCTAEADG